MISNHVSNPQDGRYSSRYLSRKRLVLWDEPAYTVLTNARDISIHPGVTNEGGVDIKPLLDALPKLPPNSLTSIELFAGGGLMRLGIEHAGITTIWANDFDKNAARAHNHNFGEGACTLGDITQIPIESIPDADIIVGGPPCQDFSLAGKGAGEDGERGKLVWRYLEIIERKQPKAFLFENVKGLITKKHRPTFDALLQRFDEIGYNVSWRLINAWDYGVAQKRERVFIVGIRKDIDITFEFPASEYETTGYRPVLRDAIGDLPEPHGTPLSDKAMDYMTRDPRHLQKHRPPTMEEASPTLPAVLHKGVPYGLFYPNHEDKPLTDGVYTHARDHRIGYNTSLEAPAVTVRTKGEDVLDVANHDRWRKLGTDEEYLPKLPERASTRQAAELLPGIYWQNYAKAASDDPALTVACEGYPKPHPTKPRRFIVRECLRIQSVPDSYTFPDDMSLSAMYRVVGNGVASRVAYHLGAALSAQLLAAIYLNEQEAA